MIYLFILLGLGYFATSLYLLFVTQNIERAVFGTDSMWLAIPLILIASITYPFEYLYMTYRYRKTGHWN